MEINGKKIKSIFYDFLLNRIEFKNINDENVKKGVYESIIRDFEDSSNKDNPLRKLFRNGYYEKMESYNGGIFVDLELVNNKIRVSNNI